MKTLFSVPNLLSLGNLLCGCIAILNVIDGNIGSAVYLVMLACVFDFLDGFAARGLKQGSPMGKELDSLADMVTFGVVPGMVMFQLIRYNLTTAYPSEFVEFGIGGYDLFEYLPYCGFIVPLFSGLRLAKFNVDTRQSESFIGLPTLANALFICGIPLALQLNEAVWSNNTFLDAQHWGGFSLWSRFGATPEAIIGVLHSPWMLVGITVVFSFLLISEIPMFSFKVKNVKWQGNQIRYIFLAIAIGLAVWLKMAALPLIIVVYILMSVIYAIAKRSQAA